MAHMIEGNRMMYVGETPWHGIGTKLDNPPTVAEAIVAAGLNWTVRLDPLMTTDGRNTDHFAVSRDEDNSVLGVVGPKYHPLQNIDSFNWFQPFLDSKACTLHTAGCLDHGRRVWVLAHVTGSKTDIVPDDRVDSFILLSNSHDGSLAVRVGFTPIRVVCANTLSAAHGSTASKLLRIRHTKSLQDTLAEVRTVMDCAQREFVATAQQFRALAARHINPSDLRKYVRQVLGAEGEESKDSSRMKNMIDRVLWLTENGTGNDAPAVRGTLWAAYNGVTEYLSYGRGSNPEHRLNSLWFGDSAQVNARALETALALAI